MNTKPDLQEMLNGTLSKRGGEPLTEVRKNHKVSIF